jgi:hypothetical protein
MILAMTINPEFVRPILIEAGMPSAVASSCKIEPVPEGSLAITFKIALSDGKVCFLKFCDAEGAKGGIALKHLLPIDDTCMREHAAKRHRFVRKALDYVIANNRATLIPRPLYFDLSTEPMSSQKRKEREGIFAEYRVNLNFAGANTPTVLPDMVATLWQGLEIEHLPPLSAEEKNVWEPMKYAPEVIFKCTAAIGELQKWAEQFVAETIDRKVRCQKGSPEEIRKKIDQKLQHEQRALKGYDILMQDFLTALGVVDLSQLDHSLKQRGQELLQIIDHHLQESRAETVCELQQHFRTEFPIPDEKPEQFETLDFHKLIFVAERKKWWTPEIRNRAKSLAQLGQAEKMARSFENEPNAIIQLIHFLEAFKTTYAKLETLPQAIVPQDGHPFNFFQNQVDGKTTMLDLEDLSKAARFADLSTVYIFKIIRGFIGQMITQTEAAALIQATIDGYNSEVATPLNSEELSLMADYALAVFLNHLPQFGMILRMEEKDLNSYNLAMSQEEFLLQFEKLQKISQTWTEKFLPGCLLTLH